MNTIEPFVETLFRPLVQGRVRVPESGPIIYANALETAPELLELLPAQRLTSWQPRRARAIDAGLISVREWGERLEDVAAEELSHAAAGATLALLPLLKQRDESHGIAAELWEAMAPGGVLMAAAPNTGGARGYEKAFEQAFGRVSSMSKSKARVMWATKRDTHAPASWLKGREPREIEGSWITRPGVFSHAHVDPASRLLMKVIAKRGGELKGDISDIGAGWGYLGGELVRRGIETSRLTLWEEDLGAARLAGRNAEGATVRWADITRELPADCADTVVMNAPFHEGHRTDVELGWAFLTAARRALRPGGVAWIVANVHLPYEQDLVRLFDSAEVVVEREGFKVLRARRAP